MQNGIFLLELKIIDNFEMHFIIWEQDHEIARMVSTFPEAEIQQ